MASAIDIAGDVTTAATALAGLLLVFLGSILAAYDSYQTQEQNSVRRRYQRRAWFAFLGLILAIASVALAITGKWLHQECLALAALACLALGLLWSLLAAFFSVREIR